jgi:hypothetical protein
MWKCWNVDVGNVKCWNVEILKCSWNDVENVTAY